MSEWQEVTEEGVLFWINRELGNIQKTPDGKYVVLMPKIIKLGPFDSLDQAKQGIENNKNSVEQLLKNYNDSLLSLSEAVKVQ